MGCCLLSFLLMYFSPLMVFSIALDRFLHVYFVSYSRWMSPYKAKLILVVLILLALSYATGTLWACSEHQMVAFNLLTSLIDITLFALTSALYICLFLKVYHSSMSIRQQQQQNGSSRNANARHVTYLATKAFLILLSLFVCYLPYVRINVIIFVRKKELTKDSPTKLKLMFVYHLTICIALGNSGINALILLYRNRSIYQYINTVFKRSGNDEP